MTRQNEMLCSEKLKTERLILRPHSYNDWPKYLNFMQSERSKHIGGPFSIEDSWRWFCVDIASWSIHGIGTLAICDINTLKLLGQISLNIFPHWPEPEIGWFILEEHQGSGYITEAANFYKNYLVDNKKVNSLVSYVDKDNISSIKIAKAIGGKRDVQAQTPLNDDCLVFRHF